MRHGVAGVYFSDGEEHPEDGSHRLPRAPARCGKNGKEGVGEWWGMGTGAGVGGTSRAAASERAGWRRQRWRMRMLID